MFAIILSLLCSIRQGFQTRAAIQAEIIALRHQLLVLQRSTRAHKLRLTASDRLLWVWLWSGWRSALVIVKPETVIAWHRSGFRSAESKLSTVSEQPTTIVSFCATASGQAESGKTRHGARLSTMQSLFGACREVPA